MNKTINPDLVLEAAKLAIPTPRTCGEISVWRVNQYGQVQAGESRQGFYDNLFNPLTSDSDAWALEGALMDESNGRWRFGKSLGNTRYVASCREGAQKGTVITEKSRPLLALAALSAMTGLPLYLEDKQ